MRKKLIASVSKKLDMPKNKVESCLQQFQYDCVCMDETVSNYLFCHENFTVAEIGSYEDIFTQYCKIQKEGIFPYILERDYQKAKSHSEAKTKLLAQFKKEQKRIEKLVKKLNKL